MTRLLSILLLSALGAGAARVLPEPAPANAALRYWMAFAAMDNARAEEALATALEATAAGRRPWDDSLAAIVDRNRGAIEIMRRGSHLPACDWGLEHEQGPDTPVAHLPLARALARLNVLHGMRLARGGDAAGAVRTWLDGVRFSRHVAADGPFISALVGGNSLKAHLAALGAELDRAQPEPGVVQEIRAALDETAPSLLDWGRAAEREGGALTVTLQALERADDPLTLYRAFFPGAPAPDRGALRTASRRARLLNDRLTAERAAALRAPYPESAAALREVDRQAAQDPLLERAWPSSARIDELRQEVEAARASVLARLDAVAPR